MAFHLSARSPLSQGLMEKSVNDVKLNRFNVSRTYSSVLMVVILDSILLNAFKFMSDNKEG